MLDVVMTEPLFSTSQLCQLSGATFRQVDYWCRNDTLPAARRARGQGSQRAFTREQIIVARVLRHLAELGAQQPVLRAVARDMLFSSRPWGRFMIATPDGRVRHVRRLEDLVGGWVVDVRAAEIRVDTQLQLQLSA